MRVKICGLKTADAVSWSARSGAAYFGFVFFPKSPRDVSIATAKTLTSIVPSGRCKVALTVNASDDFLDQLLGEVPIDMLQLHGNETPERVAAVKALTGLPVMKAVGISDEADLIMLDEHMRVADQILCDAKPPRHADLPGGNGLSFDWRLISGRRWSVPWMLAGGLTPANVAEAVRLTKAPQVDVSSGVESQPGLKDMDKIAAFVTAAKGAN